MSKQLTSIGLDEEISSRLVPTLNDLLANYQVLYQNLRGFHWNIKGKDFFELHTKFEEYYTDALLKIDEIAERILTLGGTPLHTFTSYVNHSEIKEVKDVSDGSEAVEILLGNISILLEKERNILGLAEEVRDEGTNSLISDYIKQQEKTAWMLNAYLGN